MIRYAFLIALLTAYFFIDLIDYLFTPYFKGLIILGSCTYGIYDTIVAIKNKRVESLFFLLTIALIWFIQSLKDPILSLYLFSRISGIAIFIFVINSLVKASTAKYYGTTKIYITYTIITIIGIFLDKLYPEILSPIQKYDIDRSYFLLGTSSNIFICLAPGYFLLLKKYKRITGILISIIVLVAIYISGSRIALILFLIIFSEHLNIYRSKLLILGCLSLLMVNYNTIYEALLAFITLDPGNLMRIHYWIYLKDMFTPSMMLIGDGLGYLITDESVYPSKHFESSLIVMIIEGGLVFASYIYIFWFKNVYQRASKVLVLLFFINSLFVPMFPGPLFGLMSGLLVLTKEKGHDS